MGWKRKKEKEEKTNLKLSATRMISVFLVSGLCILYISFYLFLFSSNNNNNSLINIYNSEYYYLALLSF